MTEATHMRPCQIPYHARCCAVVQRPLYQGGVGQCRRERNKQKMNHHYCWQHQRRNRAGRP